MAAPRRLKVFRTAIGFHDAYVAASSKKAALEAWGAKNDLFAIGSAEVVTDAELTKEPLASPGVVIRRTRGSLSEQLAALPEPKRSPESRRSAKSNAALPTRHSKPPPRPSRAKLEKAEQELEAFQAEAEKAIEQIKREEAELHRQRTALEKINRAEARKLEERVAVSRKAYDAAVERWRSSD